MSTPMYNLSELIKTDCCIDCGTNEKLREVVGKMTIPESDLQKDYGVLEDDTVIFISGSKYDTSILMTNHAIPLTSINIYL